MAIRNNDVVTRWASNIVMSGEPKKMVGSTVRVEPDGAIHYFRSEGQRRRLFGPVDLGVYLPRSKSVLLNGDGFADGNATHWQTVLRNSCLLMKGQSKHLKHVLVIPFAALTAAGIEHQSIRPIDVRDDENIEIYHRLEFNDDPDWWQDKQIVRDTPDMRVYESSFNGQSVRRTVQFLYGYIGPNGEFTNKRADPSWRYGRSTSEEHANVFFTAHGNGTWQRLELLDENRLAQQRLTRMTHNEMAARQGGPIFSGEIPVEPGYYWTEVEHHLGACVFSGEDETGRHKFISSFDEDEPGRMYFLAQLPDRSGATTYEEAILALAPPIVHKARLEGRTVRRQGDVFAIATNLTDDEVYAMAKTRVRRNVAMFNLAANLDRVIAGRMEEPKPDPGEVSEVVDCPCLCGHRRRIGSGPKARKALMIYGTGHTADEVVTTPKGTTYVRGTMHHEPGLQEPGRRPEHAAVVLGSEWFLAVRNTVPRKRSRRQVAVAQPEEGVTAS